MSAKKKNLLVIVVAVLGCTVLLVGGSLDNDPLKSAGVVLVLSTLVLEIIFLRCPNCRRWLGRKFRPGKHCPHCGEIIE
ncbi:hypothetical protein [Oscillibacter sp.]|uniref:hypothetical protein n=1 Tax=Oscillibacter sp. TaxID=1945593 RepID=UPI0025F4A822|nr:hypothetical protein [Oscillibacter sp.]